jgi:hypothetical protein
VPSVRVTKTVSVPADSNVATGACVNWTEPGAPASWQTENSEVLFAGSVAVAVKNPPWAVMKEALKVAPPEASVVAVVAPR